MDIEMLNKMQMTDVLRLVRFADNPVEFAQMLIEHVASEVSQAARDEISKREAALKQMKRETKTLQITFG